ncbi:MAG: DUF998 domain-containing protein [Methanobacteriaceae archaeon]|nr:DUF998 domain-containing protein [Methanobacteriaceae archaeon]
MKIQRGSLFHPEKDYYKAAGIILLVAVIQFFMAVNLAETQYPDYNIANNTLSSLGGTLPSVEPSATIFNTSIILLGILSLLSVYLILESGGCRLFSSCLTISAMGLVGIGIFPSYAGGAHTFFAFITLLFGCLAVIFSYRLGLNIPMIIISMITGLIGLSIIIFSLVFGMNNLIINYLGVGGTERFVAYPLLLYFAGLGGYLTCRGQDWVRIRFTEGYF